MKKRGVRGSMDTSAKMHVRAYYDVHYIPLIGNNYHPVTSDTQGVSFASCAMHARSLQSLWADRC